MRGRPLCVIGMTFFFSFFFLLTEWPLPVYNDSTFDGQTITVVGEVSRKECKNGKYQIYLKNASCSDRINSNEQNRTGKSGVLLYLSDHYDMPEKLPRLGSNIRVKGKKRLFDQASNPGQFDTARYYQCRGMDYCLQNTVILWESQSCNYYAECMYRVRQYLTEVFLSVCEKQDAEILSAVMLGEKNLLEPDMKDMYQRSGAGHLLVVSGLHISLVGYALFRGLKMAGLMQTAAALIASFFVYSYALLAGMGTSAQRALIMFLTALFGECIGRAYDLLTSLALASLVLLFQNPLLVLDSGFLLSFGSIMGIGVLLPAFDRLLPAKGKLISSFKASLSVSVFTFPITLYFFYQYPLYSIFFNLVFVPLMSVLFLTGFLTLFFGIISVKAGMTAAVLPHLILWVYEKSNCLYAELPFGNLILGRPEKGRILLYYVLIASAVGLSGYLTEETTGKERCIRAAVFCIAAGAAALMLFPQRPEFEAVVLDVGQGDCNYIRFQDFHCLIDGGSTSVKEPGKYRMEPFLKAKGVQKLDLVFLSHMDADHVNGIYELMELASEGGVQIGCILIPPSEESDEPYQRLREASTQAGIPLKFMKKGDCVSHGRLKIFCLYPEKKVLVSDDKNENSMVLKVENENFRGLFTGDLEGRGEEELLASLREEQYILLKAGHHGSKGASSESLLRKIRPRMVTVSCGEGNSYGHPHQEFLNRVQEVTEGVYITKDCGAISIMGKNHKELQIKCYKEER